MSVGAGHGSGRAACAAAPDSRDRSALAQAQGRRELSAKVWDSFSDSWDVCWGRQPLENLVSRRRLASLLKN